jgi:hypothetical protein
VSVERRAPIQGDYWLPQGTIGKESGTISWAEHLEAYEVYAAKYGRSQSAERIAERGGFGHAEFTALLGHAPQTYQVARAA